MKKKTVMWDEEFGAVFIKGNAKEIESPVCKYNPSVDCIKKDKCKTCGWYPSVAKKRAAAMRSLSEQETTKRTMRIEQMTEKDKEIQELRRRVAKLESDLNKIVKKTKLCEFCKRANEDPFCKPELPSCKPEYKESE